MRIRDDNQQRIGHTAPQRRALPCLVVAAALALPAAATPAQQSLPPGYVAVTERAALTAIDNPRFVPAAAAALRDDAWVLGVVVGGRARAYGLDLLNRHEVVNDEIGGVKVAVVWSPYANAAAVFNRDVGGVTLEFDLAPGLLHGGLVLRDRSTGSYWPVLEGGATAGPLAGTPLSALPVSDRMLWAEWVARHPGTQVLSAAPPGTDDSDALLQDPGANEHSDFFAGDSGYGGLAAENPALRDKALVYGFLRDGVAYAVDARRVIGGQAFELQDGTSVLVYREAADRMFRGSAAFVSRAGFEQRGGSWFERTTEAEFNAITRDFGGVGIERLNGFDVFWYAWSLTHPDTRLLR